MKIKVLITTFLFGVFLISCDSIDKKLKSRTEMADSIKKAKEFELEQMRQDSIEAMLIKGYSVKKLSGKHKYGGVTKIEYKSCQQLIDEVKERADKQMWANEVLQSNLDFYKRTCKAGQVILYIERTTIGSANTEYFTIIIKDKNENELYRKELENDIPEYSSDWWWNYGYAYLDKRIKAPFYVYVVDRLEDAPFKFEVTAIKK